MDGRAISRVDFWRLFSVIGTDFGAGNGTTTFNVPDAATLGLPTGAGITWLVKC
jgi:microcystin-dependent protein